MTAPAQPPTKDSEEDIADTPQIRALRKAVIGMALLLVVGFVAVIGRVVYLVSRPPAQASAVVQAAGGPAGGTSAASPLQSEAALDLPADASIRGLSLAGDRLAVHYSSPRGDGISILDLASGRVVSRVKIAPTK